MENKPIRILHYIGSLNVGGSQTMIMEIYRKIDRKKIQFDFVVDRKNELFFSNEIMNMGGIIYEFDEYFKGINYLSFVKQWDVFFENHKEYNIVHCHVRSVASIVLKIAKKHGLKTICHSHSTSNGSGIKAVVKKILQGNIKNNCDYFFACSKESARWLYGKKIADSPNCLIINNAIDTEKYVYDEKIRNEMRKKLRIENRIVLGQVGRIETVKNHEFSLFLLKELLKKNKKYCLLIVGDGSLKEYISAKINELKIKNDVILLGNRNDVNNLMQAMDIYIMPSLWEGLPLSLIEAQASDLPCVISNTITAGILDCNLVKQNDLNINIEKWCETINDFLKHKRKNNAEIIISNKFDIKENVKLIEKKYEEMEKLN